MVSITVAVFKTVVIGYSSLRNTSYKGLQCAFSTEDLKKKSYFNSRFQLNNKNLHGYWLGVAPALSNWHN